MLKSSGLIIQLSEKIAPPVVICVKNIASTELWVDDDFEMIAVEVKGMDPIYTWEIIGIYSVPNEGMFPIGRLGNRTLPMRN
jgi:hypothetical protein